METIYEDTDLLVVNKPPGLVIDRSTMEMGERLVVHRLDKDTSGLLIFAKTPEALEGLQRQFKERKVKKRYLALVHGKVTHPTPRLRSGSPRASREATGVIDKPIGRAPKGVGKFVVIEGGRASVTKYKVRKLEGGNWKLEKKLEARSSKNLVSSLELQLKPLASSLQHPQTGEDLTLLDIEPLSGRTHQIRVHLKSIGHPVVGDKIYASRRQQKEDEKIIKRQFLHAYRLGFEHPRTGEWLVFEVDLPEDLQDVLRRTEDGKQKTGSKTESGS